MTYRPMILIDYYIYIFLFKNANMYDILNMEVCYEN